MLIRAEIERLIPHAGQMCLLDSVTQWDKTSISCTALSHQSVGHPLRSQGRLRSVHAIEYAAQAGAVHGALVDPSSAVRSGVLASVRQVQLKRRCLEDLGPLEIVARRLVGGADGWMYGFVVSCGAQTVAEGRYSVMFPPT